MIYEGRFQDGRPNGAGRLINGDQEYIGNFTNGLYSGEGRLQMANGDVYTGAFREGMIYGNGKKVYTDGKAETGFFVNGILLAQAKEAPYPFRMMDFFTVRLQGLKYRFENKQNTLWIADNAYDLTTGALIADRSASAASNIAEIKSVWTQPPYDPFGYDFLKAAETKYQKMKYRLMPFTLLKREQDFVVVRSMTYKGKKDLQYTTVLYKLTLNDIQPIATLTHTDNFDQGNEASEFLFTDKLDTVYVDGYLYTNKGTKAVKLDMPKPSHEYWRWYSANRDTLIQFSRNDTSQVSGYSIYKFSTADGRRLAKIDYPSNNRLKYAQDNKYGRDKLPGYKIALINYERGEALVFFSQYVSSVDQNMEGGDLRTNYNKAGIIKFNDPDYLLPLRNPYLTADYFDLVEKGALQQSDVYMQDWLIRKAEAARNVKIDLYNIYAQPVTKIVSGRTTGGTESVCAWCKGTGKITSADAMNKGFNADYTTYTGSKSRGTTSYTTMVCGVCHGTGH
ncbi:hypothetical protein GCM10027037_00920 [Mucilaginibacter koreensis]